MPILKLVQKQDGLIIAQAAIVDSVEETKMKILASLIKRWRLRWEEDE